MADQFQKIGEYFGQKMAEKKKTEEDIAALDEQLRLKDPNGNMDQYLSPEAKQKKILERRMAAQKLSEQQMNTEY